MLPTSRSDKNSPSTKCEDGSDSVDYETANCSTAYSEKLRTKPLWQKSTSVDMCLWDDNDDMCQFDDNDDFPVVGSSFNPMSEPLDDDWTSKVNASPEQRTDSQNFGESGNGASTGEVKDDFRPPCEPVAEDGYEVTETKIRAFLHEKAVDLRKMQTPLFEFYNTLNGNNCHVVAALCKENTTNNSKLPPKSNQSPSKMVTHVDVANKMSTGSSSPRVSTSGLDNNRVLKEILSPCVNESEGLLQGHQLSVSGWDSASFYERQKKWEEELDQELARLREERRQSGLGMKSPSTVGNRKRHRSRFDSPSK